MSAPSNEEHPGPPYGSSEQLHTCALSRYHITTIYIEGMQKAQGRRLTLNHRTSLCFPAARLALTMRKLRCISMVHA